MNANEMPPRNNSQMNRIQKVSGIFRTIFLIAAVCCGLSALGRIIPVFLVKAHTISKFEFITFGGIEIACAIWAWFCYKLFNLCAHGDLFTSKVVSYIRRVGYAYFLMAIVASSQWLLSFYGMNDLSAVNHPYWPVGVLNLTSSLFPGFLIIFIAWVMDEGRKIREEQELTV
jgi:Protein of unknown function (DUF2975)